MYLTKTAAGRGFTVLYPFFEGDGYGTANDFYETMAKIASEYFEDLVSEDRRSVCRCTFSVEESEDVFVVTVTFTLRRSGRKCGEKTFSHIWRRWEGRDAVIEKKKQSF